MVSSPNTDWCPWFKSGGQPVCLRADGTFGWDDPVSWSQPYHSDAPHLACIPVSNSSSDSLLYLFRCVLRKDQVTFTDSWNDRDWIGRVSERLAQGLKVRANHFLKDVQALTSSTDEAHTRLNFLTKSLETSIAQISQLQDTLHRLRIPFGLISRYCLEARGYIEYHVKYPPTIRPQGKRTVNSNLVGVWTESKGVCAEYFHIGIPMWYLHKYTQASVTEDKFIKRSNTRCISYDHCGRWTVSGTMNLTSLPRYE